VVGGGVGSGSGGKSSEGSWT
jgi:hypothetical protein